MRKFLITSTMLLLVRLVFAQSDELPNPKPYFSALIVKEMSTSLSWYSEIMGYEVVNNKSFPEMNFKQANLKRGDSAIELIELGSAISPTASIPNFSTKSKLIGLFKIGFRVEDFDNWIKHLEQSKVDFHGNVVTDEISGKRMIIVKDPDGNRIQLFER